MKSQEEINFRTVSLVHEIGKYFHNKTYSKYNKNEVILDIKHEDHKIVMHFTKLGKFDCSLTVPTPFIEDGILFIQTNGTKRPVGTFYTVQNHTELDYIDLLWSLFLDYDGGIISSYFSKYGAFVKKIANSFEYNNTNVIIKGMQRIITDIVTRFPVHETAMNSWAMNNRVQLLDPRFDNMADPAERLKYQEQKAEFFFARGWTSMGLSDGVLDNKNYILKSPLSRVSPFAVKHHNPQRNLYSTLGMLGDEKPLILSETMAELEKFGINRTGWNLFTLFADIPEVFEDQIIVDRSLCSKYVDRYKTYQCFGRMEVKENDVVEKGTVLSTNDKLDKVVVNVVADKMWVDSIKGENITIGGMTYRAFNVTVKYRRFIKDGTKITNLAANKGVVRVKDLGYATNPVTGERKKIEVLASAKATDKRENYTQILEAIANNVNNDTRRVYVDDLEVSQEVMEKRLEDTSNPKDGCWECDTYVGKIKGVCGKVFWGVTMDAETMCWDEKRTKVTNNRGVRTSGLKFSSVEFRALETRFGKDNALIEEIMKYSQGTGDMLELLKVMHSKEGSVTDVPEISFMSINPIDQSSSILITGDDMKDTIAQDEILPDGFVLKLPVSYQIDFDKKGEVYREGTPIDTSAIDEIVKSQVIDKVYVPYSGLRKCWKHPVGKYGLSEIASCINTIIDISHRYIMETENTKLHHLLMLSINNYFSYCSKMLGSKRGDISIHGMSIRYPNSMKGVATLSNDLPKNTVEIHKDMAKRCEIKDGDVVLVERFPCLGFMSLRPQTVRITDDPLCLYTIRVSGNSLGSLSLDFDGDTLYIAKFYDEASNDLLHKEWRNPNKSCYDEILRLNAKAGKPRFRSYNLADYKIRVFPALTSETQRDVVSKTTSVKANTGPVTALAYNIMRMVENSDLSRNQKVNVAVEVFLDKVANSVFKQKHGIKSLHEIVVESICKADVETLVEEGFRRGTSTMICDLIKKKASEIGVNDLAWFYENSNSNIISSIVRRQNRVYFCSRAMLEGTNILKCLQNPVVDLPSKMLSKSISKHLLKQNNHGGA